MSYILEALKKADQERDVGAVPNLATPQETERPRSRSPRWLWVVAVLLSVNVVLAFLLLQDRYSEAPEPAQASFEQRPAPTGDSSAQPVQQIREIATSETPAPKREAPPEKERTPSGGQLVLLPEPASPQYSVPSSAPEAKFDTRMDAMTTTNDSSQLPHWYELPQAFRNGLSLPRLDLHAYSEEPRNRFILVNLKKYREGDRLESGLILEEIFPDGMVMSYQGERFLVEK